jgi:hypothetical protein
VLGDERSRQLVKAFVDALERADPGSLVGLLTQDAAWTMPPLPSWYRGSAAIGGFLAGFGFNERWRHLPTWANGQLALGCYTVDPVAGSWVPSALAVLSLQGERIAEVDCLPGQVRLARHRHRRRRLRRPLRGAHRRASPVPGLRADSRRRLRLRNRQQPWRTLHQVPLRGPGTVGLAARTGGGRRPEDRVAYTGSMRRLAPTASATFRMWVTFEVTTASPRRRAPSTTETSTMSS